MQLFGIKFFGEKVPEDTEEEQYKKDLLLNDEELEGLPQFEARKIIQMRLMSQLDNYQAFEVDGSGD